MCGAVITFSGNYGEFDVNAESGIVVEHRPDEEEIAAWAEDDLAAGRPAGVGYKDITRVDLDERRRWYAEHGETLSAIQPDGDILDVGFWTEDGAYCEPQVDWRTARLFDLGEHPSQRESVRA